MPRALAGGMYSRCAKPPLALAQNLLRNRERVGDGLIRLASACQKDNPEQIADKFPEVLARTVQRI